MPASKKVAKTASSKKPGLYANIHAKQQRIAHGSSEKMRKAGQKGAPSSEAFEKSASTTAAKKSAHKASSKTQAKSPARKAPAKKSSPKKSSS